MSNFSINPNFNMQGFENSITEFNKILSDAKTQADKNLSSISNFEDVFNSINQNDPAVKPDIQGFVGMDAISAQKIDNYNVSPTARMASDIGSGITDGLKSLSATDKKAETDLETFASGGDISVHDVMISTQKSQLAMQMAIQLRNQMINAYQEFKSMNV